MSQATEKSSRKKHARVSAMQIIVDDHNGFHLHVAEDAIELQQDLLIERMKGQENKMKRLRK